MSEILTRKSLEILSFHRHLDRLEATISSLATHRYLALNGEVYFTDRELSERLKVSRRTLQEWRGSGHLSYVQFPGKVLYPSSSVQQLLARHHRPAFYSDF